MAREALVKNRTAAKDRAKNLTLTILKRQKAEQLSQIKLQMAGIEKEIMAIIEADPGLAGRIAILVWIPGASAIIPSRPSSKFPNSVGTLGQGQARRRPVSLSSHGSPDDGPARAFIRGGQANVRQALCGHPSSQCASTRTSRQNTTAHRCRKAHKKSNHNHHAKTPPAHKCTTQGWPKLDPNSSLTNMDNSRRMFNLRPRAVTMDISVIIPSFDRHEATLRAVASVRAQTMPVAQILVVDDASRPPLPETGWPEGLGDLHVLRLEVNRGAAGARQAGIDAARGDVVAFLDSDDRWTPDKLARQYPLLKADNPLLAVSCGWQELHPDGSPGRRRIPIEADDAKSFASGCWFCPGSTVLLPRAAFSIVGPLTAGLRRLEDLDWFLRFALAGGRLEVAPVVGAAIATGRRGRIAAVNYAARDIESRLTSHLSVNSARHLKAYLNLERAMAAYAEKRYAAAIPHTIKSFIQVPRARPALRQWWHRLE